MNHDRAFQKSMEFYDGELAASEAGEVRSHAAACPECSNALRSWKEASEAAGGLGSLRAGPDFAVRVMEGVRGKDLAPADFTRFFQWKTAFALGAVFLFLAAAILRQEAPQGEGADPEVVSVPPGAESMLFDENEFGREEFLAALFEGGEETFQGG